MLFLAYIPFFALTACALADNSGVDIMGELTAVGAPTEGMLVEAVELIGAAPRSRQSDAVDLEGTWMATQSTCDGAYTFGDTFAFTDADGTDGTTAATRDYFLGTTTAVTFARQTVSMGNFIFTRTTEGDIVSKGLSGTCAASLKCISGDCATSALNTYCHVEKSLQELSFGGAVRFTCSTPIAPVLLNLQFFPYAPQTESGFQFYVSNKCDTWPGEDDFEFYTHSSNGVAYASAQFSLNIPGAPDELCVYLYCRFDYCSGDVGVAHVGGDNPPFAANSLAPTPTPEPTPEAATPTPEADAATPTPEADAATPTPQTNGTSANATSSPTPEVYAVTPTPEAASASPTPIPTPTPHLTCSQGCLISSLGDGFCTTACNVAACGFDCAGSMCDCQVQGGDEDAAPGGGSMGSSDGSTVGSGSTIGYFSDEGDAAWFSQDAGTVPVGSTDGDVAVEDASDDVEDTSMLWRIPVVIGLAGAAAIVLGIGWAVWKWRHRETDEEKEEREKAKEKKKDKDEEAGEDEETAESSGTGEDNESRFSSFISMPAIPQLRAK